MTRSSSDQTRPHALHRRPSNSNLDAALENWVRNGESEQLREVLTGNQPADIALALGRLDARQAVQALQFLEIRERAVIFGYLRPQSQLTLARTMTRGELAAMIAAMSHDERADLFRHLNGDEREDLLPVLAQTERDDVRNLSAYPEGTVGAVMTTDYATLPPELMARDAIEALRLQAPDSETIYQAFIVDDAGRLVGTVSLRDILIAPSSDRIADLMESNVVRIAADASREAAARLIAKYDLVALPVVDGSERLLGIVTQDDAMDVQEEEATQDFHRASTIQDFPAGVREASPWTLYRARIVWLVLLVFGNVLSGAGIALFEDTIAAYMALVFFLPVLIGSGGNAGSQSATLMIRAMATGDVGFADWGYLLVREVLVAALLGVTMAVAIFMLGLFRSGPEIALVVALSMVIVVLIGSLIGMSLPFLLAKFRLDPATASAPLVTSIADVAGVIVYFTIATSILPDAGSMVFRL